MNAEHKSKTFLTDGEREYAGYTKIDTNTGMQKDYLVLTPEEHANGFVRPYRAEYIHTKCGELTRMHKGIAETYARDPCFYTSTYCTHCRDHFPLHEFVWENSAELVGS